MQVCVHQLIHQVNIIEPAARQQPPLQDRQQSVCSHCTAARADLGTPAASEAAGQPDSQPQSQASNPGCGLGADGHILVTLLPRKCPQSFSSKHSPGSALESNSCAKKRTGGLESLAWLPHRQPQVGQCHLSETLVHTASCAAMLLLLQQHAAETAALLPAHHVASHQSLTLSSRQSAADKCWAAHAACLLQGSPAASPIAPAQWLRCCSPTILPHTSAVQSKMESHCRHMACHALVLVGRRHDVLDSNDVVMLQVPQQLDLPQRPLGIRQVLKGIGDLLDGHLLLCPLMARRAHHTVGPLANGLYGAVHLQQRCSEDSARPADSAAQRCYISGAAWRWGTMKQTGAAKLLHLSFLRSAANAATAVREGGLRSRRMHCSCLRPHAGADLVYFKESAP